MFRDKPLKLDLLQRICEPRCALPQVAMPLIEFYSAPLTEELRNRFAPSLGFLNQVIPLDYMGSVEFEFGSIPQALRAIAQEPSTLRICRLTGFPEALEEARFSAQHPRTIRLPAWCVREHRAELIEFLQKDSRVSHTFGLKEPSYLQEGLFGKVTRTEEQAFVGWMFSSPMFSCPRLSKAPS